MRILVRTLHQQQFHIDVEPDDTVGAVKEKIAAVNGYDTSLQKLIFSGRILQNAQKIKECNVKETDFLVVMMSQPKPNSQEESSKGETKPAASSESQDAARANPNQSPPKDTPPTSDTVTAAEKSESGNSMLTGTAYETAVGNLMEMGFDRSQVVRAMQAAFHNPERATEYLLSGIPVEHARAPAQQQSNTSYTPSPRAAPGATAPNTNDQQESPAEPTTQNLFELAAQQRQQSRGDAGGGPGDAAAAAASGDLSFLRNSPQFQQLRSMIRANPDLLQPLLQQIGQSNPILLQVINSNPEGFLQLLRQGAEEEATGAQGDAMARQRSDAAAADGSEGPQPGADGGQYLYITPQEKEAIDRLEQLGFDRNTVVEAYFACDKNEQLAANYLFEHGNEDD